MQAGPIAAAETVDVVKALAPLFAAGFAIQQLTDLIDSGLSGASKIKLDLGDWKKFVIKLLAVLVGGWFVFAADLKVLAALAPGIGVNGTIDHLVGALIVGGGTEGVNSIVKFLGYAKEDKKADAGKKKGTATEKEKNAIAEVALT